MHVAWIAPDYAPTNAGLRYRVLMPMRALSRRGHRQEFFCPERQDRYDVVVFGRAFDDAHRGLAGRLRNRRVATILDLSDNHFDNPYRLPRLTRTRDRIRGMMGAVDLVTCTTPTLAEATRREAESELALDVVPDYAEHLALPEPAGERGRPALLWFGNPGSPNAPNGISDLNRLRGPLRRAFATVPFDLVVCSNDPARYAIELCDLGIPARYVPWTEAGFPAVLADADAVLIPATRSPFVDAKSPNRLTLALRAGVPVLATAIPSYRAFAAFCHLDDWDTGLSEVLTRPDIARSRARAGARHIEAEWGDVRITDAWLLALSNARLRRELAGA